MNYHSSTDGTCMPECQWRGGTITWSANGSSCLLTEGLKKAARVLRRFARSVARLLKTKTATDTLIHTSTEDPSDKAGGVDWATRPEQMPSSYG